MSRGSFLDIAWWPQSAQGQAVEWLLGADEAGEGMASEQVEHIAARLGGEAVPVCARVRDLGSFLAHGGPALVRVAHRGQEGFLALCGARRGDPLFLGPGGGRHRTQRAAVEELLTRPLVERLRPEVGRVLAAAGIAASRRARVSAAMIAERIGGEEIDGLTMLRLPSGAGFARQFRQAGLPLRLVQIVALFVLFYGAELWGWQLLGGATLSGRLDWGWFAAWLLLAFTMVPGRLLAGWNEALFALETGRLVKSRLLAGALALPPDAVKRQGVGTLIGKVMESQALEGMALSGGFAVIVGLVELGFAFLVLRMGAAPGLHGLLLALFAVLTLVAGLGYNRRIAAWTRRRLQLTNHLVEAMVGHRTRLAQEPPTRRNQAEDGQLAAYLDSARGMDRSALVFGSGLALGWAVSALLALGPALASPQAPGAAALAVSLGGMMLAQRALGGIGGGMASLSRAGFAWQQVRAIFRAGRAAAGCYAAVGIGRGTTRPATRRGPVLEARSLHYSHEGATGPVLAGVDLAVTAGDRILVEGPSGGGKSTLAGLLTGLRRPEAGLLLLDGLDRPTIGDDWHARVTAAPQFHENHILSGTLAFNLLMGRQWPATEADLAEAEALCERLGLGELLSRMPGGIHQRVGETGWQLSHGERSRIFLARALLQRADVTILDESFASLDPATMDQCLRAALEEAETLVVIAHP